MTPPRGPLNGALSCGVDEVGRGPLAGPVVCAAVVLGSARRLFALRFEIEGAEAPHPGPILVLARHASIVDNLLPAWFVVRPHAITLRYVLKKELLSDPVLDVGGSRLPNYFVDRSSTSPRAELRGITELATDLPPNEGVLIFPEGTRIPPGKRGRYRIGGAVLSEQSGYPIIPVAHNAGEYWPRRSFIKRPGVIQVRIGPPIYPDGKSAQQILEEAADWIEGQMAEITTLK